MRKIELTPEMVRDLLHNLDPENPEHMQIYYNTQYYYMVQKEGVRKWAYDDETGKDVNIDNPAKGKVTVGIGFNMDTDGAEKLWNEFFHSDVDFESVYWGLEKLTWKDVDQFFEYCVRERKKEIKRIYSQIFHKLKLNERFAIEDLYFNGPKLVKKGTKFHEYIHQYYETNDIKYLHKAVDEVRYYSNPKKIRGLQNRRNEQADILDSSKAKIYSAPNDERLPEREIIAKVAETIIPRGTEKWEKNVSSKYYIWRTQCDKKVRESHFMLEGKIFSEDFKPLMGEPGKDYNCRCTKELLPKKIKVLEEDNKLIQKKCFDINLDLFGIEIYKLKHDVSSASK